MLSLDNLEKVPIFNMADSSHICDLPELRIILLPATV